MEFKKSFLGNHILVDGKKVKANKAGPYLKQNAEAFTVFKKGYNQSSLSTVSGLTGGLLVGINVGNLLINGGIDSLSGTGLALGGGLILLGVIVDSNTNAKMRRAVRIYNEGLASASQKEEIRLSFGTSSNGVGLHLSF